MNRSPADFGKVAVVFGGRSSEREVSLRSGNAVLEALLDQGIDAFAVDGGQALVSAVTAGMVDRVFNILHGGEGENGALAGAMQVLRVPMTGCDVLGAAISMDKVRSKILAAEAGVDVPRGWSVTAGDRRRQEEDIVASGTGPWIVKPSAEGSSVGLYRVQNRQELRQAIQQVLALAPTALVEEFIQGDECTVAIVNGQVLPVVRIQPAAGLYDYEAKYESRDTAYHCPSGFDQKTEQALQEDAMNAFNALALRGWARLDFIVDKNGRRWFLEANTTPGMTETSLVPKAAAAHGWDFKRLVREILETSLGETAHE